jgi:mannose-6-phosphate isomerase-like protein (cupin superfamily)
VPNPTFLQHTKFDWLPQDEHKRTRNENIERMAPPEGEQMERVSIAEKFTRFAEHWKPKIIAELNGQEVKLVKVQGTFPWHHHDDVDEMFLVWRGHFRVEFRDKTVELGPGELVIVPHGIEHRTAADEEAEIILLEPAGVLNTGNVVDDRFTAPNGVRI